MLKTYKTLSVLLTYPTEEIQSFLPEISSILESEHLLDAIHISKIKSFADNFSGQDLIDWQEQYVQLFDNTRSVSLYLFEHVHGESKDRGSAMVDLMSFYVENGFDMNSKTLPDYIPAFLEFLSSQAADRASELLAETIDIFGLISHKLNEKNNVYASILDAIIALSKQKPSSNIINKLIEKEPKLSMDEAYEEAPIEFNSSTCEQCKI